MKTISVIGGISIICGVMAYVFLDSDLPTNPTTKPARSEGTKAESQGQETQQPLVASSQSDDAEIDYSSLLKESEKAHLLATGRVLSEEDRRKLRRRKLGNDIKALMPTLEEIKVMMDTPVEIYGQVLDQFDQPVVGANIRCSWAYMGPPDSARECQSSAPTGRFEILGLKAMAIGVAAYPPPGYDESVSDNKNIQIARASERVLKNEDFKKMPLEGKEQLAKSGVVEEPYKPDKTKPVIFRLKRL